MNPSDLRIGLNLIPGIGSILSGRALEIFSSPEKLTKASIRELMQVEGIGSNLANSISAFQWESEVCKEKEKAAQTETRIITFIDSEYPDCLKDIYDPPQVLYIKGDLKPEDRIAVSIVGSRIPTTYGKIMADKLTRGLVKNGITIVSGFARGIDTAAHCSALDKNGRTLAVFGCGINVIYPPENRKIYGKIIEKGALISEFPMDLKPDRFTFPRRNRIISGLSIGTVVVEAAERSGALITADFALEQGREVFAIPGPATSPKSRGTNRLIKKGAKLVETVEDIIEELPYTIKSLLNNQSKPNSLDEIVDEDERLIYSIISEEEIDMDKIVEMSNLPPGKVSAILLKLEIKGLVRQLTGPNYIRICS